MERNNTFNDIEYKRSDTSNGQSNENPYRGKIRQIGNLSKNGKKNPQSMRVYDQRGIAPTLSNYSGGGGLVPLIVIDERTIK